MVVEAEPNQMLPPSAPVAMLAEPSTVSRVNRLLVASAWKRIVLVPEVASAEVLAMVSALPPLFRPSTVTLSAPLKSTSGPPETEPLTVRAAPPAGWISSEV